LLCLLGGTLGFLVAGATMAILQATWPASLPVWGTRDAGAAASAFAIGLPVLTALLFGAIPLRAAASAELYRALAPGGRSTVGRAEGIVHRWLVVLAVGASVALLVGAGLLLRTFAPAGGSAAGELGYDPADTLTYRVVFEGERHATPAARAAAQTALLTALEAVAGVSSASFATEGAWLGLGVEDRVSADCGDCVRGGMWLPVTRGPARHHAVGPGYFESLGIPLLRGRTFTPADDATAPRVAVVSQTFARQLFLGRDPVGRTIQVGGPGGGWFTVAGVVGDVRARGLGAGTAPVASLYLSSLQLAPRTLDLAIRAPGDPVAHAARVQLALQQAAGGVALASTGLLEERVAEHAAPMRWFAGLFAVLAVLAAVVAGLGLFGVIAYTVARRTREMGVRVALGARPVQVVRLVVGQSLRMAAVGAWLGLLGGLSIARLLQVMFLGVDPLDGAVYAAVALLLFSVALLASYLPARRAAGVDPVVALRYE
jgi:putative ABC transport system permease protein